MKKTSCNYLSQPSRWRDIIYCTGWPLNNLSCLKAELIIGIKPNFTYKHGKAVSEKFHKNMPKFVDRVDF